MTVKSNKKNSVFTRVFSGVLRFIKDNYLSLTIIGFPITLCNNLSGHIEIPLPIILILLFLTPVIYGLVVIQINNNNLKKQTIIKDNIVFCIKKTPSLFTLSFLLPAALSIFYFFWIYLINHIPVYFFYYTKIPTHPLLTNIIFYLQWGLVFGIFIFFLRSITLITCSIPFYMIENTKFLDAIKKSRKLCKKNLFQTFFCLLPLLFFSIFFEGASIFFENYFSSFEIEYMVLISIITAPMIALYPIISTYLFREIRDPD